MLNQWNAIFRRRSDGAKIPIAETPILIGSAPNSDIVLSGAGVKSRHALLEYHPLTRSFWVRDLQSGQDGGAIGSTQQNGFPIYGMVELKNVGRPLGTIGFVFPREFLVYRKLENLYPQLWTQQKANPADPHQLTANVESIPNRREKATLPDKTTVRPKETQICSDIDQTAGTENQLVQRVIRLQNEVRRKEVELEQIRLPKLSSPKELPNVNDLIVDTFFSVSCTELEEMGRKLSETALRDYSDVFSEAYRSLQEPFSYRLMEVNTKCNAAFQRLPFQSEQKDIISEKFDHFLHDKINPLSKALDTFLPVLKESAGMARESVKACHVFSEWSRDFASQLSLNPSADHMSFKVDELQNRFRANNLSRHWLPPSVVPILRTLITEIKNKNEEIDRLENEQIIAKETICQLRSQVGKPQKPKPTPLIITNEIPIEENPLTALHSANESLRSENSQLRRRLEEIVGHERAESPQSLRLCIRSPPFGSTPLPPQESDSSSCSQPSTEETVEDTDSIPSKDEKMSTESKITVFEAEQKTKPKEEEEIEVVENEEVERGSEAGGIPNSLPSRPQSVHSLLAEEEEKADRKDTKATEADIDENILDSHVDSQRKQNAIEFWELAHLLAKALSVHLPASDEADFSSIDQDEGVHIERHRREIAVDAILDKLHEILGRIRRAEEERVISRQQSIRSNKSDDRNNNRSSGRRESVGFHRAKSVVEKPGERTLLRRAVTIINGESEL